MEAQSEDADEAMAVRVTVRRFLTGSGLILAGFSTFVIIVQPAYGPQHPVQKGVVFLALGLAELAWAWLGNWEPPDAEQRAQSRVKLKRIRIGGRIFETAIVTLALLGLLFPEAYGSYWQSHKLFVLMMGAGVVANLVTRLVRYMAARSSCDESAESAS